MHKNKIIKLNILHINEKNARKIVDNMKEQNYNENANMKRFK